MGWLPLLVRKGTARKASGYTERRWNCREKSVIPMSSIKEKVTRHRHQIRGDCPAEPRMTPERRAMAPL